MKSPQGFCLAVIASATLSGLTAEPPQARLTGIVSLANKKRALLELKEETQGRPIEMRYPILLEGERYGNFAVTAIDEKTATVKAQNGPDSIDLRLEQKLGEE